MYDLVAEVMKITGILEDGGIKYALCGGLAVGIYTEPRATIDIDLVVEPDDLERIIERLKEAGYEKFSGPMPLEKGRMNIQRLVKLEQGKPEVLMLDLCMPDKNKYKKVWKDWRKVPFQDAHIWVLSREGLIEMKSERRSDKDLLDLKALEKKGK